MIKNFFSLIVISFVLIACVNSAEENKSSKIAEQENPSEIEQSVSTNFIGQSYSRKETNSFGNTVETFSFENNGVGNYYCSWVTEIPKDIQKKYNMNRPSKYHEDSGALTWKIIDGEIHVYYTYHASDGVVSHEERAYKYDEGNNKLFSTEYDSEVFSCVSSNKNKSIDENSIDEEEYNRQREQEEYESDQGFYLSGELTEGLMTFKECSCGAEECSLLFVDQDGKAHKFYQNEITTYDFGCPIGFRYKNKKFKIEFRPMVKG
jgi:hypothetical protein